MSNMTDYLDWRGDLSFARDGLNEVDALAFAWLAYYEYEKLETPVVGLTLKEISDLHEAKFGPQKKIRLRDAPGTPIPSAKWFLKCVSETVRFSEVRVCDFTARNEETVQFGAISFQLPDRRVVAFRGTDSSVAGWREDCDLSFSAEIPSQHLALKYLNETGGGDMLTLCGHSKGGNNAIYAASHTVDAQRARIERIWNFDGPGFCYDISASPGYSALKGRITKIVPECSIVGMLLKDDEPFLVVGSKMKSFFQHNAMFWQILGPHFAYLEKRSDESLATENLLRRWMGAMPFEERREFTDVLFTVIERLGITEFTQLDTNLLLTGRRVLSGISSLTHEQRKLAVQVLLRLARAWRDNMLNYDYDEGGFGDVDAFKA